MNGKALRIENFKEHENRQKEIHILLLEDNPADAELIEFELEEAGFSFTLKRVETEETFKPALKEFAPHLILSDYDLPTYSGIQALSLAKKECPHVPFILVTGAVTEDRAIEVLTSGARDYVLKNRLSRLVPAVQRALAETEEHRARRRAERELQKSYALLERRVAERTAELQQEIAERKRTEEALRASEAQLETTMENLAEAVIVSDPLGNILHWNQSSTDIFGIENPKQWLMPLDRFTEQYEVAELDGTILPLEQWPLSRILHGERLRNWEACFRRRESDWQRILSFSGDLARDRDGRPLLAVISVNDVTERKRAEESLKLTQTSVDVAAEMIAWFTPDGKILYVNDATCKSLGYSQNELIHMTLSDIDPEFNPERLEQTWKEIKASKFLTVQTTHRRKDGSLYPAEVTVNYVQYAGREYQFAYGMNIKDRKRAEQALRESEERFRVAQELSPDGFTILEPVRDKQGHIVDFTWLYENAAIARLNGTDPKTVNGKRLLDLFPGQRENSIFKTFVEVADTAKPAIIEEMFKGEGIASTWFRLAVVPIRDSIAILSEDITEKKLAEENLQIVMQRFYNVLSEMFDAVLLVTNEGVVEFANKAYCEMFHLQEAPEELKGLTAEEMLAKIRNNYLKPDEAIARIQEIVSHGQPVRSEQVVMSDGKITLRDYIPIAVNEINYGRFWHHFDVTELKRTEKALKETEAHFRLALKNAPVSVAIQDRDLRYIWAYNQKTASPKEIIGKRDDKIFMPEEAAHIMALKKRVLDEDIELREQMWFNRPSGRIFLDVYLEPVHDEKGNVTGVGQTTVNLTPVKMAEDALKRSEEQLREMADAMPQLVWTATPEGRMDYYNKRREDFPDLIQRESGYWDWQTAIHPDDLAATLDIWRKAIEFGADNQIEHRLRQKDGSFRWNLSRGVRIKDDEGKIIKWIGTTTDIHDLKQAEQESKCRSLQLEDANKELESFSYSVSHDLRAPLRAIDGFSRMLLKSKQALDQETNRRIQVIRENAVKMDRLINDLLCFSRSGRAAVSFKEINMGRLVKDAWQEQLMINPERGLELNLENLPKAKGDLALIRQVLSNLLANAIKFTKNREKAVIEIGGESKGKESIYYVRDNGTGFDMKYSDKLFGVFQRLHTESEYEGTGVGLAIVQRIIHRHGGRVWAKGEVDKGATFYFSLPVN